MTSVTTYRSNGLKKYTMPSLSKSSYLATSACRIVQSLIFLFKRLSKFGYKFDAHQLFKA